jgi:hypothetical protein
MHSEIQHLLVADRQRALRREADEARLAASASAASTGRDAGRTRPPLRPLGVTRGIASLVSGIGSRVVSIVRPPCEPNPNPS